MVGLLATLLLVDVVYCFDPITSNDTHRRLVVGEDQRKGTEHALGTN
jgi:hypothetical protein